MEFDQRAEVPKAIEVHVEVDLLTSRCRLVNSLGQSEGSERMDLDGLLFADRLLGPEADLLGYVIRGRVCHRYGDVSPIVQRVLAHIASDGLTVLLAAGFSDVAYTEPNQWLTTVCMRARSDVLVFTISEIMDEVMSRHRELNRRGDGSCDV